MFINMNTSQIELAMYKLQEAYNCLNALLPKDTKQEQMKFVSSDYASDRILKIVREEFNADPLATGNQPDLCDARHAYRYLLRTHTKRSTKSIAMVSNALNHTTVLNSVKRAKALMEVDKHYADLITKCEARI